MTIKARVLTVFLGASSLLGFAFGEAAFAETTIAFKSTGVAIIEVENVNLSDGSIVQKVVSTYVWTETEGEMAGQSRGGSCIGLGQVTVEGVYSGVARCNESISAEDSFTTTYTDTAEGGDWVVTGGKGKYAGATGTGHVTYVWGDPVFGDKITMTNEGTMTLQ